MARLYADENFPRRAVEALRDLAHDVATAYEHGNANRSIPDQEVLTFATQEDRAVLTFNRKDFIKLYATSSAHAGIIICTFDTDYIALAQRIHTQIDTLADLHARLIRITRLV